MNRALASIILAASAFVVLGAGCASDGGTTGRGDTRRYSFWPPPPNEPRIQFLRSFRMSSDIEKPATALDKILFGDDRQQVPIAKPYGVAVWNGRIYVCDITNPAVVILDLEKRQTRLMLTRGVEQMAQPTDIAIAADGMKYVVDRRRGRIFVFDADDRHIASLGEAGFAPVGLDVYGDELYVADFATQSVVVMDRHDGTVLRSIGGPGGRDGEFVRPLGVEIDSEGNVYVGDAIGGRVQQFDPAGEHVRTIGALGDGPGSFVRPKHLALDGEGVLFVVDGAFQNVQMFTDDGQLLMFFGGAGLFDGAMNLPAGLTIDDSQVERFAEFVHPAFEAERLVFVTNQFGLDKVAVYAFGQLREGFSVSDVAGLAPVTETDPAPDRIGGLEPVEGTPEGAEDVADEGSEAASPLPPSGR